MSVPGKRFLSVFCLLFLVLLSSCAGRGPRFVAVMEEEERAVMAAFALMREKACAASFNAEVDVTMSASSVFGDRQGKIFGYLLAAAPASIKFVGVNPIGQPMILFASNGQRFRTIIVHEGKGYEGPLAAEKVQEYAPAGFADEPVFYWLTGRIPPDLDMVRVLGRIPGEEGVWLEARRGAGGVRSRVLFDPAAGRVIKRVVHDGYEKVLMDVRYSDFEENGRNGCQLPGVIEVGALRHNGRVILELHRVESPAPNVSAETLSLPLPPGFQAVEVR